MPLAFARYGDSHPAGRREGCLDEVYQFEHECKFICCKSLRAAWQLGGRAVQSLENQRPSGRELHQGISALGAICVRQIWLSYPHTNPMDAHPAKWHHIQSVMHGDLRCLGLRLLGVPEHRAGHGLPC